MSHTPPDTPASPNSSVETPNRETDEKLKFQTVPAYLQFFLEPNLDLDARSTTKALIEHVIKHFKPDIQITQSISKPALKCLFYQHISPLVRTYRATNGHSTSASSPSHFMGSAGALEYKLYAHAFNPSFDPNHRNSTKKILYAAIRYKSPNQSLPPLNLVKKSALVALFERYVHQAPAPRTRFADKPPALAASELQGQTKDELRFALQAHLPHLFIMSHVTKPGLVNIYQRFMLGEPASAGDCAQAQVDFFMFNN